uniref:ribonuclease H n=1 Tax=Cyprinodon variegatus TaxID=28743 RepID=A0A3Q2CRI2_CYPVA
MISPAPLYPIPAIAEPFERVLVDCVGPLPRTKAGNKFLVTVMCTSTRFPEVFPVRKISTPVVVKALTKFFSLFGLPRVVQTDQGSNFMSKVFAQVLRQFDIKHCHSSAYHPESQGALERFHQTLKIMLRTYCLEFEKDWDEGVHLQLFAIREVVQESLGFSPSDLVFAHTVRGPLRLLKEKWLCEKSDQNLLDYVSNFRLKLSRACEIAKENLKTAQAKMKSLFDRKAVLRVFQPGEKVLALLPVPGSSLQACCSGPYTITRKVGDRDYLISTPDRRRTSRLCHVNMLKPYIERAPTLHKSVSCVSSERDDACVGAAADAREELSGAEPEGDVFSPAVTERRVPNSEMLENLPLLLSHLDFSKQADVIHLIQSYRSLFADIPTQTRVLSHDIDVGDSKPIKQHPYRVNPDKLRRLKTQVEYMVEHGLAVASSSAWSSPCLLNIKANGEDRFCTDFRKVNGVTRPDCYPFPRMEDCVYHVGASQFVTKLDLLKGYWQVPLTAGAQEISAFVTPNDFLQYTVMAFGMRNAPATFQGLMNVVLSGLSFCEAYLDDLVICSSTWTEHVDHLRTVFTRLSEANLTVNLSKCQFSHATVTYLGKRVGGGQVRPVEAKVEANLSVPVPTTRTELRRYLAMVVYYRGFCKNFSSVAAPLTDLLSPKLAFIWSDQCQSAFEQTKHLLVNAPVLSAPRFDVPFKLAVDACDSGVGAVLLQDGTDGVEHPVSYFSKKLYKYQRWYSTIEKEALALVLALEHFEVYVGGSSGSVVVFTDHNPLVFLARMRNKNRRLMNWSLRLQSFNISIQHVRGKDNVVADALSRL